MLSSIREAKNALLVCFCIFSTGFAQNPSGLTQASTAFTSKSSIDTVTLDGTFLSEEGSLKEEGTAHFVAKSDGTYSVSLAQKSGMAGERRSRVNSELICTWQDSNGSDHPIDRTNCQTPAWFLPELPIFLSSSPKAEWILSSQADNGIAPHLAFNYNLVTRKDHALPAPLQVIDIELSKSTLLPTKASYYIHPDRHTSAKIPIEITYEDFRSVAGVNIPFRIRKFVNGTLVLDVTLSGANVN